MDVLVIGQSNASNWFNDFAFTASRPDTLGWNAGAWRPVLGEGAVAFSGTIADATGETVRLLNAAQGSTSLTGQGASWLASGGASPYGKMLANVHASGLQPDAVIWIQGENDAASGVSSAKYLAGLEQLFGRIGHDFGNIPFFLQPLILPQPGKDAIVAAQHSFAASHANARLLAPSVELAGRDQLHFTPVSYNVLGDLMAREVLSQLSRPSAPQIFYGSQASDSLAATADADRVYGGTGDDTLQGLAGNDVLLGEQGNDWLVGGSGDDLLGGGSGDDTLQGGPGRDLLTGNAGRDTFVFAEAPGNGVDVITDFASRVDRLAFDDSIYDTHRVVYLRGNLSYDGKVIATLQGAPAMAAADLVGVDTASLQPPAPSAAGDGGGDAMSGVLVLAGALGGLAAWFL
jgi:hypothetical protein